MSQDTPTATASPPPRPIDGPSMSTARLALIGTAVAAVLGLGLAVTLFDRRQAEAGSEANGALAIAVQPAPRPAPIKVAAAPGPLNGLPEEAANLPANAPVAQPVNLPASQPQTDQPAPHAANTRPAFHCEFADGRAERMICSDDRLAAADRRMDRAYQQALDAGVPSRILRRQQRAWLRAREDAARDGSDAMADLYGERIAELEGMAQGY